MFFAHLHWSMALEVAIIPSHFGSSKKSLWLPWRIPLPKPLVLLGISWVGPILLEACLPTPALRQPVLGAIGHGWIVESVYPPHLLSEKEMSC